MRWGRSTRPTWWRGQRPDRVPVWTQETAVVTGQVTDLDLASVRLGAQGLRTIRFDHAVCTGLDVCLDEVHLATMWSSFNNCSFRQRSRRLVPGGSEPQGSFGTRPSLFTNCRFVGVRLRVRAGFDVGQARFEDCTFERCRFEEHFSWRAEFVRCTFIGPIKTAVFFGVDPETARRNEIVANDFTAAAISDNVAWRRDFPIDDQAWPERYRPPSHPVG